MLGASRHRLHSSASLQDGARSGVACCPSPHTWAGGTCWGKQIYPALDNSRPAFKVYLGPGYPILESWLLRTSWFALSCCEQRRSCTTCSVSTCIHLQRGDSWDKMVWCCLFLPQLAHLQVSTSPWVIYYTELFLRSSRAPLPSPTPSQTTVFSLVTGTTGLKSLPLSAS